MKKYGKRRPRYWHLKVCTRDKYKRYYKANTAWRGLMDIRMEGNKNTKGESEVCVDKCVIHSIKVVREGAEREKDWYMINVIRRQDISENVQYYEIPKPEARRESHNCKCRFWSQKLKCKLLARNKDDFSEGDSEKKELIVKDSCSAPPNALYLSFIWQETTLEVHTIVKSSVN